MAPEAKQHAKSEIVTKKLNPEDETARFSCPTQAVISIITIITTSITLLLLSLL